MGGTNKNDKNDDGDQDDKEYQIIKIKNLMKNN